MRKRRPLGLNWADPSSQRHNPRLSWPRKTYPPKASSCDAINEWNAVGVAFASTGAHVMQKPGLAMSGLMMLKKKPVSSGGVGGIRNNKLSVTRKVNGGGDHFDEWRRNLNRPQRQPP